MCSFSQYQSVPIASENYPHLWGLELAKSFKWPDNGGWHPYCSRPLAIQTKLGWVISGLVIANITVPTQSNINCVDIHILKTSAFLIQDKGHEVKLNKQLSGFWELESLGIRQIIISVSEIFLENISFDGEKHKVKLTWKYSSSILPDTYKLSAKRLTSLLHRLWRQPDILIAKVHYLLHHKVIRKERQTIKLRVVYNAYNRLTVLKKLFAHWSFTYSRTTWNPD